MESTTTTQLFDVELADTTLSADAAERKRQEVELKLLEKDQQRAQMRKGK